MLLLEKRLTKRTVILLTVFVMLVVMSVTSCLFAESDQKSQPVQVFTAKVYPAEPGVIPTTGGSQIQSQPILIPAKKSGSVIPGNADLITTPAPLVPDTSIKIQVPGISPALIPDVFEAADYA